MEIPEAIKVTTHSLSEQSRQHRTNPISAQSDPDPDPAADPFHKSHHFDSQIKEL